MLIVQRRWMPISTMRDTQAYTPHTAEYVEALGGIIRELSPDLLEAF